MTWSWNASVGASRYVLHDQSENQLAEILDTGAPIYSVTENDLHENTQHARHVHALGGGEISPPSNVDAPYTLIHTATTSDFTVKALSSTTIGISVVPPHNSTAGKTGVQILRTAPTSKVTGPKLKIKPVDALGPTEKTVDEAALAAQRAIPRKARWIVTTDGEVSFTWYIMRLADDSHGTDEPPQPTVKNTSKTGTASPIDFDCLTPGCYVIVIVGAQAEGAYSGYVQGDVPNGAHRFFVVESDLDVVIDCDQSVKVSQPHALPKLYPETVVGTPEKDDLMTAAPTLSCCTGLRFRLVTVPTFTLQFPGGGVLTADNDKSGFTGFSTKPESCDSTASRTDFFKLFADAGGTLTINIKSPTGDVLPYVKIDYKVPAPKREVTLNFYFVQGSDGTKATSALANAPAADQDAYARNSPRMQTRIGARSDSASRPSTEANERSTSRTRPRRARRAPSARVSRPPTTCSSFRMSRA